MKDMKARRNCVLWRLLLFVGLLGGTQGFSQDALKPNPKAEDWVKKQVVGGNAAVLLEHFSREEECVLRGSFLEKLLLSIPESEDLDASAVQIQHAIIVGAVNLSDKEFACGITLKNCRFEGAVDFSNSHFPKGLDVGDTAFVQSADFHGLRSDGDVSLHQAVFQSWFDMKGALIQGDLRCSNARFLDLGKGAVFTGMEASENIVFRQALFAGPVRMEDVTAGGLFLANEARFMHSSVTHIQRLFANGTASFAKAEFKGVVDFSGGEIHGSFIASEANFSNFAHLLNMKVDDGLFLQNAVCLGPLRLGGADVRGTLNASGTKFLNPQLSFELTQTSVREARFNGCQIDGPYRIDRFSYESIFVGDREEKGDALLAFVENAYFCIDAYQRLEGYYRDRGFPHDADRIYIAFKERERRESLRPYSFAWCSNWLLGKTTQHGRSPERPLAVCAAIVLFGTIFMFRAKRMKALDPYAKQPFSPFWYSLDLFLPLIDLHAERYWIPKPGAAITRFYSRVHILLGWIFVPLFLASWFGWIG